MVAYIVQKTVNALIRNDLISEEQKEDYSYAMICIVETVVGMTIILLISILVGKFPETACFLAFFFFLRRRTGGYHLQTYAACCIGSLGLYGCVICISKWLTVHGNIFWGMVLLAVAVILRIATVNHPDMHMSSDELKASRKCARITVVLELMLLVILEFALRNFEIVVYSGCGIICCSVPCLIAKLRGEEVKSNEEGSIENRKSSCGVQGGEK